MALSKILLNLCIIFVGLLTSTVNTSIHTVKLPIPSAEICGVMKVIWPRNTNSTAGHCICRVEGYLHNSFEQCVNYCESNYAIELLQNDSVIFYNLSSTMNDFLVHFFCDWTPCDPNQPCYLITIISSHRVITKGCINALLVDKNFPKGHKFIVGG